jgi:hypothetical protein
MYLAQRTNKKQPKVPSEAKTPINKKKKKKKKKRLATAKEVMMKLILPKGSPRRCLQEGNSA